MNLDSARNLKLTLSEKLLVPMAAAARSRGLPGEAVRSFGLSEATPPTLALGVVRRAPNDFALAVRIQQRALERSRDVDLITRQAKGEVDVRYIGSVSKRGGPPWPQQRQRPLRLGCSVGHYSITAGTLGAFVRPRGGGSLALLSNNHVLANENRAKTGDAILQPGVHDGGADPADAVATLTGFVKIKRGSPNLVDAAFATLADGVEADLPKLTGLGKLKGAGDAFVDEGTRVAKLGRTTGLTRGRLKAFELDNVTVEFDLGVARFDNQIEIEGEGDEPFSQGGDSGSLIVGEDRRGLALLFAGSDQGGANGQGLTYANPIHAVLDTLKLELAL